MKIVRFGGPLALPLPIAACGQTQQAATAIRQGAESSPTAPQAGNIHSAIGDMVESLGWPAIAMTFRAGSPEMAGQMSVGGRVPFSFRQDDGGYTMTSLSKGG